MTRSKKPTQRRRKPSPAPRDESSVIAGHKEYKPWEPHCVAETAKATEQLNDAVQKALDENEKAYWSGVSELGLAHEAEVNANTLALS